MRPTLTRTYRDQRRRYPERGASYAYAVARERCALDDTIARFTEWDFGGDVARTTIDPDTLPASAPTIRVSVMNDETDWGDIEPTDAERENARSYVVAVDVIGADDDEIHSEAIGGIETIDLPGYIYRDWEDAAACALNEYLLPDAERIASQEPAERAYWAQRDVATV